MKKVYFASKMHHAEKWRNLYHFHKNLHMVSRWPYLEPEVEPTAANAQKFWDTDLLDIVSADYLIVYALEGENLRGALVEVGMAIGLGKTVICIGDSDEYGTWRYHKQVLNYETLEQALEFIIRG